MVLFFRAEAVLLPPHPPRATAPHHPFNGAEKNKAWWCFIAMCLRSVHSLLSSVPHPLRYSSFRFITSSLLRSVHFTHLSTTQQKWLILYMLQSPLHWLSVSWHPDRQGTQATLNRDCSSHSKPASTHWSIPFNPHLCSLPTLLNFGMLYFFQRLVCPIHRTEYNWNFFFENIILKMKTRKRSGIFIDEKK